MSIIPRGRSPFSPFPRGSRDPFPGSSHNPFPSIIPDHTQEMQKEAQNLVEDAKNLVNDGKRLYENSLSSAQRAQSRAEQKINEYGRFASRTAETLGQHINPVLERFDQVKAEAEVSFPRISDCIHISTSSSRGIANSLKNLDAVYSPWRMPSIVDVLFGQYQLEKAKKQHDEAEEYKERMYEASEELLQVADRMKALVENINEEMRRTRELVDKVVSLTAKLQNSMDQGFDKEEIPALSKIRNIAGNICSHLESDYLGDDGRMLHSYISQSKKLDELNRQLPDVPKINSSSALDIVRLLDSVTVC